MRHTNALVIADRGFPFWPMIETVDISLVDDVPTVLQLIAAVRANHNFTLACMAREFQKNNSAAIRASFARGWPALRQNSSRMSDSNSACRGAIGLIRTGDTTPYANVILISG